MDPPLALEIKSSQSDASVGVVIVNWRQPKRTIEAAHSIALQSARPAVIVVVDNGSNDNSVDEIAAGMPDAVIIARNVNGGFGAGCNAGIEYIVSKDLEYVWLINNDAIPEHDCLELLLAKASSNQEIAVTGARIKDPEKKIVDHAGCVMNPLSLNCTYTLSENELARSEYGWITGASMLLSSKALKKIGFFKESYFMYWEDADLCCRMRRAGFRLAVAEGALVKHAAGTSSNEMRISRYRWHIESQIQWVKDNYFCVCYGVALVYVRHLVKSAIACDWDRFLMTIRSLKRMITLGIRNQS
jgi:GT2 family glycosyltransferase